MSILTKYIIEKYLKNFIIILLSLEIFFVGIDFLQNFKSITTATAARTGQIHLHRRDVDRHRVAVAARRGPALLGPGRARQHSQRQARTGRLPGRCRQRVGKKKAANRLVHVALLLRVFLENRGLKTSASSPGQRPIGGSIKLHARVHPHIAQDG